MKRLISMPFLYICFIALFAWIISTSLTKRNEPTPKLYKNTNGSNGDIISINQEGIWTLNKNNITLWNQFGDVISTAAKPINSCDKIWVKDSFVGIYGRCGNAFYKIRKNNQSFALFKTSIYNMFDLCISDSNLLIVNHNPMLSFTNYNEDYNLRVFPNKKDINGYLFDNQKEKNKVDCLTYCEMNKGLVYFIDSNKGVIKSISFNNETISFKTYIDAFIPNNYVYYKLNKLSDTELTLMVEEKVYLYEVSNQGLSLKSTLE